MQLIRPLVRTCAPVLGLSLAVTAGLPAGVASAADSPSYPIVVERRLGPAVNDSGHRADLVLGAPATTSEPVTIIELAVDDTSTRIDSTRIDAGQPGDADAAGGTAAAGDSPEADRMLSLYVSDKVADVVYERDGRRLGIDNARVGGGFLISERRDNVFTGHVMLDTRPGLVPDVRLSFGARGYVALLGQENRDVFGVGLGVQGLYTLPVAAFPLEIAAGVFYTPDIFAFGQSDRIIDWNVDVGLQLRESFAAFAGVRYLQFDTRPGTREVDNDVHVGLRWTLDAPSADEPRVVFD